MKASEPTYLFDSLDSKVPNSSRKVYIRRVVDILQMSIHRHDWPRAKRAWSILVRCPDFEWKGMWRTGLLILQYADSSTELRCLDYLRMMMLQSPENVSDLSDSANANFLTGIIEGGYSARNNTIAHKEQLPSRRARRT